MIDIATWVIVVPLGAIAYIVWHGLKITLSTPKRYGGTVEPRRHS
jgi:hypothetical protein